MKDFMQRVVVKNLTNVTLDYLELTHDGKGAHKSHIKYFKSDEKKELAFYTLRVDGTCNLILSYRYNNQSKSIIVYDKLSGNDRRVITLEITDSNGNLNINTIVNDDTL